MNLSPDYTLRHMACAYIWNGTDVLMMKKSDHGTLFPDLWVPVGGHVEPGEMCSPTEACLREIEEETGFDRDQIENLKARYLTIRRKEDEVRFQHIFFCRSRSRDFVDSEEGQLSWIPEQKLLALEMSTTNTSVLRHHLNDEGISDGLYVGVVEVGDGEPDLIWTRLESLDTHV